MKERQRCGEVEDAECLNGAVVKRKREGFKSNGPGLKRDKDVASFDQTRGHTRCYPLIQGGLEMGSSRSEQGKRWYKVSLSDLNRGSATGRRENPVASAGPDRVPLALSLSCVMRKVVNQPTHLQEFFVQKSRFCPVDAIDR